MKDEIFIFDRWGKLSASDSRGRFDNVLQELTKNPTYTALIIMERGEGETEKNLLKRVKFIKDHVFLRRKFAQNRIVIASESSSYDYPGVKVYLVPHDVSFRTLCGNCRVF